MTRGDSYYLGSGLYSQAGAVNFNTAGTSVITINGAIGADHCTDTGWSTALDTSASPAHFVHSATWSSPTTDAGAIWLLNSSNWKFNGNNCPVNQVKKTGQGILLDNSAYTPTTASGSAVVMLDSTKSGGIGNITMTCVEIMGEGMGDDGSAADFSDLSSVSCNSAGTAATITLTGGARWFPAQTAPDGTPMPASQVTVSGVPSGNFNATHVLVSGHPANNQITYPVACTPNATAASGSLRGAYSWWGAALYLALPASPVEGAYTFSYMSIHDAFGCAQINGRSPNGVFDHNYYARNYYNAPDHSAGWTFEEGVGTYTLSNSQWTDIESTAWITDLYGAYANGMNIYGNTFAYSPGNPFNRRGVGNAIFSCINSNTTCNNVNVFNNTVVNVGGTGINNMSGVWTYLAPSDAKAANWTIENNLAYNSNTGARGGGGTPTGTLVVDYNTYLNNTAGSGDSGAHSSAQTAAANPFVSISGFNFALSSDTIDAHLNDGTPLAGTFSLDPLGITRGTTAWDRGAYQTGTQAPVIQPPTALTAVAH